MRMYREKEPDYSCLTVVLILFGGIVGVLLLTFSDKIKGSPYQGSHHDLLNTEYGTYHADNETRLIFANPSRVYEYYQPTDSKDWYIPSKPGVVITEEDSPGYWGSIEECRQDYELTYEEYTQLRLRNPRND